jgi:hypothetical protein
MTTRAQRGKCVLPKDNLNVKNLPILIDRGIATSDLVLGIIDQVAYDAWQIAHDNLCDSGPECVEHANPLDES